MEEQTSCWDLLRWATPWRKSALTQFPGPMEGSPTLYRTNPEAGAGMTVTKGHAVSPCPGLRASAHCPVSPIAGGWDFMHILL